MSLMKKNILLIILSIITFNSVDAKSFVPPLKGSFSGTIKDALTGLPIRGASVYLADIKAGSSSDANGVFNISNISEGMHLVEISHIGYTTVAENIFIQGDVRKDFMLSESIIENNAVIVTGVTKATQLKKVPF